MKKWKTVRPIMFVGEHLKGGKWIPLKIPIGSVFTETPKQRWCWETTECFENSTKHAKKNERFVILFCEGIDRLFQIGKDVVPHREEKLFRPFKTKITRKYRIK